MLSRSAARSSHNKLDRLLTSDDIGDIVEDLLPIQDKAMALGLALKLPLWKVKAICRESSKCQDMLTSIIEEIVKQVKPKPTWRFILRAVRKRSVDNPRLADEIEESLTSTVVSEQSVAPVAPSHQSLPPKSTHPKSQGFKQPTLMPSTKGGNHMFRVSSLLKCLLSAVPHLRLKIGSHLFNARQVINLLPLCYLLIKKQVRLNLLLHHVLLCQKYPVSCHGTSCMHNTTDAYVCACMMSVIIVVSVLQSPVSVCLHIMCLFPRISRNLSKLS